MPSVYSSQKKSDTSQREVTLLTTLIRALTDHLKAHPKDYSTKRGLLNLVSRRGRVLRYLAKRDIVAHGDLCQRLLIRK